MAHKVEKVVVSAYRIPTDGSESDGTIEWDSTTLVLVELWSKGICGIGFSYASESAAVLISEKLKHCVVGAEVFDIPGTWQKLAQAVRNLGRSGIASTAISAVDIALWDLKSKLLDLPLVSLLGRARKNIDAYASGGFTSYSIKRLEKQLGGWAGEGFEAVKMKVGREPEKDLERVRAARRSIGKSVELFVDANGAHFPKQALAQARRFEQQNVTWFEEPASSDDLAGLRFVRERAPVGMRIAAGEYGYDSMYCLGMLRAGAVDVLQADVTRCLGVTGFLEAAALCDAFQMPLSAHTSPSIHQHLCCAVQRAINVEYFYDHYRIEHLLFDGAATAVQGKLSPDPKCRGLGLRLKQKEAKRFLIASCS
jgi:L-alanine-DL-glutamate epimerase-like enolase superfamily enzyme